jgi:hypothetical protein
LETIVFLRNNQNYNIREIIDVLIHENHNLLNNFNGEDLLEEKGVVYGFKHSVEVVTQNIEVVVDDIKHSQLRFKFDIATLFTFKKLML